MFRNRSVRFILAVFTLTTVGGMYLLLARHSLAQPQPTSSAVTATRWEYTIVRLEGVQNPDASVAQLNRYGANGWEAVELLPPSYDILMKRSMVTQP